MLQNILLNTLAPLKIKNEIDSWENRPFTTVWPENVQQKKRDVTRTIKKKKQKRVRTAFSTEQLRALERTYTSHRYIDSERRADLAKALNIGDKCIKIWFQNRRMKEKKESSESSCDSSSESLGHVTPSMPDSPQLEVTPCQHPSEQPYQFYPYFNSDHYQLPTYYNVNRIPLGYGDMQPHNFPTYFCSDNNVYPTQYYPVDATHLNCQGNDYSQYGSENDNCWASAHNCYYAPV